MFPRLQKLRPSRLCIGTAGKQVRSGILVEHLFFYKDFAISFRIDGINHKISMDMTIVKPTPSRLLKKCLLVGEQP